MPSAIAQEHLDWAHRYVISSVKIELKAALQKDPNHPAVRLARSRLKIDKVAGADGVERALDLGAEPAKVVQPFAGSQLQVGRYR